ncbi:MAG TPA: pyridoxal phosphate-dependent aminotransferase [Burkholderiaceae bacterium]|nr:pyridoxal phosphate-dependent aminotransferase [Burkholderiaceae bacterium]
MSAFLSPAVHARLARIAPFHVMELVKQADARRAQGHDLVYLAVGEPDFTAPEIVQRAAIDAMTRGDTAYTPALGLWPLREAISGFYARAYGLSIDPRRIVVTAGASGALLLACVALVGAGEEMLMPDPGYPCNRHFVAAVDGVPVLIPSGPAERFQLSAAHVREHWGPRTRGVVIASPSNPTGTSIAFDELNAVLQEVHARHGIAIVDEIYQGLSYDGVDARTGFPRSALELSDRVISINSFSKFFNMTGWRLGWLVAPEALVPEFEKLSQNLYICPSTIAQHAAIACFSDEAMEIYVKRRAEFKRRRDFLVPAFESLGLKIPVKPDGAFYVYADVSAHSDDSDAFCQRMLTQANVVMVPGADFGRFEPKRYVRASYATAYSKLEQAVERLAAVLR